MASSLQSGRRWSASLSLLLSLMCGWPASVVGQAPDCPYPILFAHGFTGSQFSWDDFYADARITALWGSTEVFHAVLNATTNTHIWGADQTQNAADSLLSESKKLGESPPWMMISGLLGSSFQ